ncbi:MAG TPA: DUF4258 domain-containing protein [Thermoanaerobaculia bacterium]|jgi:hypothetical protein
MTTLIELLEEDLTEYEIEYRVHATRRMFERQLHSEDVEHVLGTGRIIERYDVDLPLRRLLISGRGSMRQALHVVVVVNLSEKRLSVITTYEPDPRQWSTPDTRRQP